jgi:hypothetical protein
MSRNAGYELLVRGVLSDGTVTDDERRVVDLWAQEHHISPAIHESALAHAGWTLHDWERGFRAADAPEHTTAAGVVGVPQ